MTLQELQSQIKKGGISNSYIVFECDEKDVSGTFLAFQYTYAIAKARGLEIFYIDDLESLFTDSEDIFYDSTDDGYLKVYYTNEFDCDNVKLNEQTNLIIIALKIAKNDAVRDNCKFNTIKLPKLENWQIKDYMYSVAKGVSKEKLDWLQEMCHNDIHRIQLELDKLTIFDEEERDKIFDKFISDGAYQDLSTVNIFGLTNALTRRDIRGIKVAYPELLKSKDLTEMGFLVVLLTAFRNLLMVKLTTNPTIESTGLKSLNQIQTIRKISTGFTSQQIVDIFSFLSDIDRKIKTGEMWMDVLIDYIIVKILSM